MDDTGIPLGPQRGNSRTHQGGPSPRQPDVVEAREKFSLPPPQAPEVGGKMFFSGLTGKNIGDFGHI